MSEVQVSEECYFKCDRMHATIMVKHCKANKKRVIESAAEFYVGAPTKLTRSSCLGCDGHVGKQLMTKEEFHSGITLTENEGTQFKEFDLMRMGVGGRYYGRR